MAKLFGIAASQLIAQSDFVATEGENGGVEATQSFLIRKRGVDNMAIKAKFQRGTFLSVLDPDCDDLFAFLRLIKLRSVATIEGGYTRVTADFTGYTSSTYDDAEEAFAAQPTFARRGVLMERPLSEHKKWKELTDPEKYALGLLINGEAVTSEDFTQVGSYDTESGGFGALTFEGSGITLSGDAQEFAKRIAQGKTTYLFPSVSLTHTWESTKGIPAIDSAKLGKITDPKFPEDGLVGFGSKNWMLVGTDQVQNGTEGFIYKNQLEYLLSEDGGYDDFLYED